VVEDRAQRAIAQRPDLKRPRGRGFEAFAAKRSQQTDNAAASAEALFGVWPALENQFAESRGCRTDGGGVTANALDRPVGKAAMA
jgi:hypothetical protein